MIEQQVVEIQIKVADKNMQYISTLVRFNSVRRSSTRFGLTPAASLKESAMLVN